MTYILNIGNTNCQTGIYHQNKITDFQSFPVEKLDLNQLPKDIPIACACVVPEKKELLKDLDIFWLSAEKQTGLKLTTIDKTAVGADRLANAVALANFAELPAICVDCGTAITLDVVDKDRNYYGGVIAPGRLLARKSLNSHTAQLPLVPLFDKISNVIGRNTIEAVASGADIGLFYMVKGLVTKLKIELNEPSCQVVFTGGDAPFFFQYFDEAVDGGIDFTLKGIAKAWELNN